MPGNYDNIKVIALCGQAGSGKTTSAGMLVEEAYRQHLPVAIRNLADPLKDFIEKYLHFPHEYLYGESEYRTKPHPDERIKVTARDALTSLGTDWGRQMWPDIWVMACIKEIRLISEGGMFQHFIVPDCRYRNELSLLRLHLCATLVRIRRPGEPCIQPEGWRIHSSETEQLEIDDEMFDFILDVSEGTEKLRPMLAKVAQQSKWLPA